MAYTSKYTANQIETALGKVIDSVNVDASKVSITTQGVAAELNHNYIVEDGEGVLELEFSPNTPTQIAVTNIKAVDFSQNNN